MVNHMVCSSASYTVLEQSYKMCEQLETVEIETGNGKWKRSNLDVHVKPLINDHLPKTISIQRPLLCKD